MEPEALASTNAGYIPSINDADVSEYHVHSMHARDCADTYEPQWMSAQTCASRSPPARPTDASLDALIGDWVSIDGDEDCDLKSGSDAGCIDGQDAVFTAPPIFLCSLQEGSGNHEPDVQCFPHPQPPRSDFQLLGKAHKTSSSCSLNDCCLFPMDSGSFSAERPSCTCSTTPFPGRCALSDPLPALDGEAGGAAAKGATSPSTSPGSMPMWAGANAAAAYTNDALPAQWPSLRAWGWPAAALGMVPWNATTISALSLPGFPSIAAAAAESTSSIAPGSAGAHMLTVPHSAFPAVNPLGVCPSCRCLRATSMECPAHALLTVAAVQPKLQPQLMSPPTTTAGPCTAVAAEGAQWLPASAAADVFALWGSVRNSTSAATPRGVIAPLPGGLLEWPRVLEQQECSPGWRLGPAADVGASQVPPHMSQASRMVDGGMKRQQVSRVGTLQRFSTLSQQSLSVSVGEGNRCVYREHDRITGAPQLERWRNRHSLGNLQTSMFPSKVKETNLGGTVHRASWLALAE